MTPCTIGRYDIKAEVGASGGDAGSVYHGYDPRFKRDVAIKVFRAAPVDSDFRARFENEVQIVTALEHPAIVPVYDTGEDEGVPFLVMRLLLGGSLARRLQRGPLSLAEATRLFARIAPALDEAHARGILHLDLKPENILFDQRGDAYIADFGMASLSDEQLPLTPYLSPEQMAGEPPPDRRSDIYALGVILLEALSGRAARHVGSRTARLTDGLPPLPSRCKQIVERATAIGPTERFETVGEMAAALSAAADAGAESAPANAQTAERQPAREPSLALDYPDVTSPLRSKATASEIGSSARILLAQLKAEMAKLNTPSAENATLRSVVTTPMPENASTHPVVTNSFVTDATTKVVTTDDDPHEQPSPTTTTVEPPDAPAAAHIETPTALETAAALAQFEAERAAEERSRQSTLLLLKFTLAEGHSRWAEMIEVGEQLLKMDPQQPAIRSATARAYKSRGTLYQYQRNFVLAIADQTRAIELDPRQADTYFKRGLAYQSKGDFENALADLTRATELAPGFAEYFFARGGFYLAREEFGRAADDFTHAIHLNSGEARYYTQRGMLYCRQHSSRLFPLGNEQLERALADFNMAIRLDPKDAASFAYRAGVYQLTGERERALRDISRAIELEPLVATYYYVRGTLHKERGDPVSARRNFERAAELGDANARKELQPQPNATQAGRGPSTQRPPRTAALSLDPSLAIFMQRAGTVLGASLGLIIGILLVYFCLTPWFFSRPGDGTDLLRWLSLLVGLFLSGHSAWTLWAGLDTRRSAR